MIYNIPSEFPDLYAKCYDFSPSPGWESIVREASLKLSLLPGVCMTQVKSKFGGLRMYYSARTSTPEHLVEAMRIVQEAENLASGACEDCGEPGAGRNKEGYYYRSCERHVK